MPLKTAQCYILSNTSQYQLYTIKPRTDLYAIKDITLLNTSQHYTPLNTSQCYAPLNIGEFYTLLNTAQYNTQQNTTYETVLRIWGERFDDSFTTCTFFQLRSQSGDQLAQTNVTYFFKGQDQSTVAQPAETTVKKCFLMSYV